MTGDRRLPVEHHAEAAERLEALLRLFRRHAGKLAAGLDDRPKRGRKVAARESLRLLVELTGDDWRWAEGKKPLRISHPPDPEELEMAFEPDLC